MVEYFGFFGFTDVWRSWSPSQGNTSRRIGKGRVVFTCIDLPGHPSSQGSHYIHEKMCGLEKVWLLSNQIPSETKGWDMLVLGGHPCQLR